MTAQNAEYRQADDKDPAIGVTTRLPSPFETVQNEPHVPPLAAAAVEILVMVVQCGVSKRSPAKQGRHQAFQ